MARDIPLTETFFKGLALILEVVGNGTPLAYGAFARAPISIIARVNDSVRHAARQAGIRVTRTGFAFSVWQEADCEVIFARLAELKRWFAHPPDPRCDGSPPRLTSSTPASTRDIILTNALFARLLTILTIIEGGHPDASGAYVRAPISIPVRTTDVVRYIAGQTGIPVTRSGIVFHVWTPEGCEYVLSQLKTLQERMVEFGTQRAELLPPPPPVKKVDIR